MRKFIIPLIVLVLVIVTYFFLADAYPKSAERYPFMVFMLVMDIYLWISLKGKIYSLPRFWKILVGTSFWIPLSLFLVLMFFVSLNAINLARSPIAGYMLGFVLVTYFAKLFSITFFLLADLVRIFTYVIRHARVKKTGKVMPADQRKISRGKFLRTFGLGFGGLLFSGLLVGMVKWAHDFRIRRVLLNFPKLPWSFEGFRIVQISDLHLGSWASTDPIADAVDIINELDADLVLFTGDLVNYSTDEAYRFKDILQNVKSRYGTYAVLGNHDYGDYVSWPSDIDKENNMSDLYDFYSAIGWKLLRNSNEIIDMEGEHIAMIGVENWSANERFPKLGDMDKALEGTKDIPVKILLSHDPTHWEQEVSVRYPEIDLTLSGHTHGFQFGVELKRFRWSIAQYVYKYWAGLYQGNYTGNGQYLYVNRGLGMIGYPGRVGILPEITLFTLSS